MLGFCGIPVVAIGATDLFMSELSYKPVSRATGTSGGGRGGDWMGHNLILWDDDVPILWDDDVAINYDGGA